MGARIYNHACAAYSLICIGYYDEALNLTRSIGEAANLIALSVYNKPRFSEWLSASREERIRLFGPGKVRGMLTGDAHPLMDDAWYGRLCEAYTHITPGMLPNAHSLKDRGVAGGIVQEQGLETSLKQLMEIVSLVALFYCKYFEYDDLFEELVALAKMEGDEAAG